MKAVNFKIILATLFAFVLLQGCDSNAVGKVNGKKISEQEFTAYLKHKRIPQQNEKQVQRALDQYLQREALASVIEEENYLDNELIEMEVLEFKKQVLISRYFEKFLKDKVSDDTVRNYYVSHQDEYQSKQVEVAHILFRASKNMPETERQAILTTAKEAYSKLQRGDNFEELVEEYSDDKVSIKRGGSLGWINEGSVDPDFSAKVFSMKQGDISEPFPTSFGFHIVKILSEPQVVKKTLESVAGDIRYRLKAELKKEEVERLIQEAKIKNYKEKTDK